MNKTPNETDLVSHQNLAKHDTVEIEGRVVVNGIDVIAHLKYLADQVTELSLFVDEWDDAAILENMAKPENVVATATGSGPKAARQRVANYDRAMSIIE
jgi:hypothetical protein